MNRWPQLSRRKQPYRNVIYIFSDSFFLILAAPGRGRDVSSFSNVLLPPGSPET